MTAKDEPTTVFGKKVFGKIFRHFSAIGKKYMWGRQGINKLERKTCCVKILREQITKMELE